MSDDPRLGPGEGAALPPQDDGDTVAPPAQARGFLITIRGTTPNAGGARFIDSTLVKRLKSIDAATAYKAQVAFYVHDAEIAAANARVPQAAPGTGGFDAEDADLGVGGGGMGIGAGGMWGAGEAWRGGGGRWGAGEDGGAGFGGGEQPKEGPDPNDDPFIPGEKITGDTQFTVLVAVVLDPPAPAPAGDDSVAAASAGR